MRGHMFSRNTSVFSRNASVLVCAAMAASLTALAQSGEDTEDTALAQGAKTYQAAHPRHSRLAQRRFGGATHTTLRWLGMAGFSSTAAGQPS